MLSMSWMYAVCIKYLVACSNELDQHPVQHLHLAAQGDLEGQALGVGLQAGLCPLWVQTAVQATHQQLLTS